MEKHSRAPRVSGGTVEGWRERVVARLGETGLRDARVRVARLELRLRQLDALLRRAYGSPHLGNYVDPTMEFAYIVLSRRTAERAYVPALARLRSLGSWVQISALRRSEIEAAIHGCGLERKKARAIKAGLSQIARTFGAPDLRLAKKMSSAELRAFLGGLPEVGPKSALCIMLYSFGHCTFPVDAHSGRVLARLGVFSDTLGSLVVSDHKGKQRKLEDAVPPDMRYSLHVNTVAHGRALCRARSPICTECPLRRHCEYALSRGGGVAGSGPRLGKLRPEGREVARDA